MHTSLIIWVLLFSVIVGVFLGLLVKVTDKTQEDEEQMAYLASIRHKYVGKRRWFFRRTKKRTEV